MRETLVTKILLFIYRHLKSSRFFRKSTLDIRNRILWSATYPLHHYVHQYRGLCLSQKNIELNEETYSALIDLVNSCRLEMANVIDLPDPEKMNCTIKLLYGSEKKDFAKWDVCTIARSTPFANNASFGRDGMYKVGENTVFASLSSVDDEVTKWSSKKVRCFVCNDLRKYKTTKYKTKKNNWEKFFISTLAFQIRFVEETQKHQETNRVARLMGFLTFDTMESGSFYPLPDLFKYENDIQQYNSILDECAAFHVGSALADSLAVPMAQLYNLSRSIDRKIESDALNEVES